MLLCYIGRLTILYQPVLYDKALTFDLHLDTWGEASWL